MIPLRSLLMPGILATATQDREGDLRCNFRTTGHRYWLVRQNSDALAFDLRGRIRIQLHVSAISTNPSRQRRRHLALEQDRFGLPESCDRQLCFLAIVGAVNCLGIGDDVGRTALRAFLCAFHMVSLLQMSE